MSFYHSNNNQNFRVNIPQQADLCLWACFQNFVYNIYLFCSLKKDKQELFINSNWTFWHFNTIWDII